MENKILKKLTTAAIALTAFMHCLPLMGQELIPAHDPVMIRQDQRYYLFCTGNGITVWSSANRQQWKREKPVFDKPPAWAVAAIPKFRGHIWAPDISYHNGLYYLFYAVSAFGKNTSAIGLVTNKTLDSASPDFKWTDHGKVIQSVPGRDMWNAIDPNLVWDEQGTPWLAFGSFWEGIKLVKLSATLDTLSDPAAWFTIAARKRSFNIADTVAGDAAIEAPFIYKKGPYYYLFVSFDYCCRGAASDYKVVVGRSKMVTGPYTDRNGLAMTQGGGSLVAAADKDWHGVGHNAVYQWDGKEYMIFHGYDARDKGRAKLIIRELTWDQEGWPLVNIRL